MKPSIVTGSEDCLYLSIFTRTLQSSSKVKIPENRKKPTSTSPTTPQPPFVNTFLKRFMLFILFILFMLFMLFILFIQSYLSQTVAATCPSVPSWGSFHLWRDNLDDWRVFDGPGFGPCHCSGGKRFN